jgi:uncharacterized damage-inducible protein DinB
MNVLTIIRKWATYNEEVNQDLARILGPLATGESPRWEAPVGSFFKNLKGLLNHLVNSDLAWLRRFSENGLASAELKPLLAGLPETDYKKILFETWGDYLDLRTRLDQAWKAFAQNVPEARLDENFTYTNFQGKSVTAPWIGLILHLLNHQTHHRGAISQILDSWGIENDYSGMTRVWML